MPQRAAAAAGPLYKAIYNKWYIDEIYNATIIRLVVDGSRWLWRWIDAGLIDGTVNTVGKAWVVFGWIARPFQTGKVQNYALVMFLALFIVVAVIIF